MKNQHQTWIVAGCVGLVLVFLAAAAIVGMRAQVSGQAQVVIQDGNNDNAGTRPKLIAEIDTGLRPETRKAILRLFVPYQNQTLFSVDVEGLQSQVEKLPWIYNVVIETRWPNQVIIQAQERLPVARWLPRSEFPADYQQLMAILRDKPIWLLDDQSQIFRVKHIPKMPLMIVSGSDDDRKIILEGYNVVQNILAQSAVRTGKPLFAARALWQDQRGAWHLWLDTGTLVDLGRDNLEARMVTLVRALPIIVMPYGGRMPRYVNLVYDKGLALRW